jgi:hypothetical protein
LLLRLNSLLLRSGFDALVLHRVRRVGYLCA